jgi:hypothetical protein
MNSYEYTFKGRPKTLHHTELPNLSSKNDTTITRIHIEPLNHWQLLILVNQLYIISINNRRNNLRQLNHRQILSNTSSSPNREWLNMFSQVGQLLFVKPALRIKGFGAGEQFRMSL